VTVLAFIVSVLEYIFSPLTECNQNNNHDGHTYDFEGAKALGPVDSTILQSRVVGNAGS